MKYSFIQPRKKPIWTLFDKTWFALFIFGILFILFIYFIYLFKVSFTYSSIEDKKQEMVLKEKQISKNENLYKILLNQSYMANNFYAQNLYTKESLKNILDMVIQTNAITLDSLEQNKYSLKLSGVTPTKEMFILLLETPLKSVFDESHTNYYKLNNGWYRFISINTKIGNNNER
ncbi:hypothetical protein [Campylobacter sp. TTU_617]|uniref:hypothetical protein n=1 Tax=Campylobacter sp. TTU_617 TaxID=2768148 RepID=UPI0019089237|nr:hypothetical protein [Campylobacter sp. TTU_617]MBK1971427.1 hypothetical protein [Campylobacter sp. TTU_617]